MPTEPREQRDVCVTLCMVSFYLRYAGLHVVIFSGILIFFESSKEGPISPQRSETWYGSHIGHEEANAEVARPLLGGHDQVSEQQVPL